ncbi:MAG TPA: sugar-binding protein [Rhizomicrobium sp.]|nr:sugar-binding protein [Rhizomicrobium sp.]
MFVSFLKRVRGAAMVLAVCVSPALAQTAPHDFQTYRPSLPGTRIDAKDAPNIDGDVSDPVWQKAPAIDEFYQLEPHEGAPADERTVVHVLYDENNLYLSIMAYDDEPGKITAHIKARDGAIDQDDLFRIYLDPSMTRRNGYIFEVNPLGARREGLVQNNIDVLYQWNTLWSAKARILPNGWSVEVVIPFRSISYDKARTDWGFDLFRLVRRKNERIRWSSIVETIPSSDISRSGTLTGIAGIDGGFGLDVQAYGAVRYQRDWDDPGHSGFQFRPSANAFYKVTPSLTGTLTVNTDFSDTPLDQRQVNIGRFGLFYPETRDFFLQDAASFEFGGLPIRDDNNGKPFFSRNIGLINGSQPVDLLVGGKLSGNYEGLDVGALVVRTNGSGVTDGQVLSAARVSMPILDSSKVGLIFTNGDPTGASRNSVAGGDFQYRSSTLVPGKELQADAYYERSFSSAVGDDDSFGMELNFPNEPWYGNFRFKQVGEDFDPALGFVSRPGIREYTGNVVRRERPADSDLRWYETGVWYDVVTGLNNSAQSSFEGAWAAGYTQRGEFGLIETWNDFEKTPAFSLPNGVVVPAGDYDWQVYHGHLETATDRWISGVFDVQCCGFYGGHLLKTDLTVVLHPDDTFTFSGEHIMEEISLPTGHVNIHIGSVDAAMNFTPDMQVRLQMQYDNISHNLGYSARYRWEFDPGSELLVTAGDDATVNNLGAYESHLSEFSVRLGHTFRI